MAFAVGDAHRCHITKPLRCFEASHWQNLNDESNNETEAPAEGEASTEALDAVVDAEADGELALEEEPIDMYALLEARYQEGIAEGIRQCNV